MYSKIKLPGYGNKTVRSCEACNLFASCEEFRYTRSGDRIWICANCMRFCERFAKAIARISEENSLSKKGLIAILRNWRDKKHGLGDALDKF